MNEISGLIAGFRKKQLKLLRKGKVVGYFCLYVPPELIEACGLIPVRLAGQGDGTAENEGEKYLHSEGCSFCKECLGQKSLRRELYDDVDRVIIPSTCDQMKRMGGKWHSDFGVKIYQVLVPATWNDPSVENIYRQEMEWLLSELRSLSGRKAGQNELREVVGLYNQARQKYRELRANLTYFLSFELAHLYFISPVREYLGYLKTVEDALAGQKEESSGKKIRLMLVGSPLGYGDHFLKVLAARKDIDIVFDATCTGDRAFEIDIPLSGDMLGNIAAAYFSRPPCIRRRPNSQFYEYVNQKIKFYRPDGIIYKTLKFCDLWRFERKRFKDKVGIPVLEIDSSYSPSQVAQQETRVEAFVEMIKTNSSSSQSGRGRRIGG